MGVRDRDPDVRKREENQRLGLMERWSDRRPVQSIIYVQVNIEYG